MSTTSIIIDDAVYELAAPSYRDLVWFRVKVDALTGPDKIAGYFASFGLCCPAVGPRWDGGNIPSYGDAVYAWLVTQHPETSSLVLVNHIVKADDFLDEGVGTTTTSQAVALGNGSAGPLQVGPSYKGPGTLANGSETSAPSSAT